MSKADELEKEAEDYAEQCYGWTNNDLALDVAKASYIASAEPREKRIEKVKYTLKKIIETVQNDRIDEYGARLVLIKDFAYECLQEIEK